MKKSYLVLTEMQAIILKVFSARDIRNPHKVDVAVRWCKKRVTTLKVDERRKVSILTMNRYQGYILVFDIGELIHVSMKHGNKGVIQR